MYNIHIYIYISISIYIYIYIYICRLWYLRVRRRPPQPLPPPSAAGPLASPAPRRARDAPDGIPGDGDAPLREKRGICINFGGTWGIRRARNKMGVSDSDLACFVNALPLDMYVFMSYTR